MTSPGGKPGYGNVWLDRTGQAEAFDTLGRFDAMAAFFALRMLPRRAPPRAADRYTDLPAPQTARPNDS